MTGIVIPSGREKSFPSDFPLSGGERQIMIHFVVKCLFLPVRAALGLRAFIPAEILSDNPAGAKSYTPGRRL